MSDTDRLSAPLQESLLTALCYGGKDAAVIQTLVSLEHFESPYREIAARVLDYRIKYNTAPANHIDDLFDDILGDKNHKKYAITNRLLLGMHELSFKLNLPYIISRTREFVRQQTLKFGIMEAAERYQQGGDEVVDDVERILLDTVKRQVETIDVGTRFWDFDRVFSFLEKSDEDYILTGIPELDRNGVHPRKGEVFLFIAPKGAGKSFFCHHIAKQAIAQRWRALHISLENYERVVNARYLQTIFSIAQNDGEIRHTKIDVDDTGRVVAFHAISRRPSYVINPGLREDLTPKLEKHKHKLNNLIVKEFPSGFLTVPKLEVYLDYLEVTDNFLPDIVLLDYPALMNIDKKEFRLSLGRILVDLRGLAKRRNFALVVPSQGNREGLKSTRTQGFHVSEDISQIFTSDIVLTYSQTEEEHRLNLARLYVSNSRSGADKFTVLISQNYAIGQFVLPNGSALMLTDDNYFEMVKDAVRRPE